MGLAVASTLAVPLGAGVVLPTQVPLVGFGGSAIVGTCLALGALMSLERRSLGARPIR